MVFVQCCGREQKKPSCTVPSLFGVLFGSGGKGLDLTPVRFTDELRILAGDQWKRVANHKFTKELAEGTIDRNVLKKYLVQDHRFLDAFVVLLASMVANARSLKDRIPGCQFLAVITGKENTYFERSFKALGVSREERAKTPNDPCTEAFIKLMRETARSGTLSEQLAVLVVCEWSYLSWGKRVAKTANREDPLTYEWIVLHSGEYFEGVVEYLRCILDKESEYIDDDEREACEARFLQAVQLEEEFFNNAYAP